LTQLDVYTEEKFEDEADMRERARSFIGDDRSSPELGGPLEDLAQQAKRHEELYPTVLEIVKKCVYILQRNISGSVFFLSVNKSTFDSLTAN
jgi:hypothetical protein